MKKLIFPLVVVILICLLAFDKCKFTGLSAEFKHTQDSLVHAVDSMKLDLVKDSNTIDSLIIADLILEQALVTAEGKVTVITKYVDSSKKVVETLTDPELLSTFNTRYPADTVSNKLEVAKPVLVSAAQDLIELDGAKQLIIIKDTIISTYKDRIATKDTIIGVYVKKEGTYKNIMMNQETQILNWNKEYTKLQLENKKLKIKSKFGKIITYALAGGLAYTLLK